MNFYAVSALINLLTSFLLAIFVLYKNVRGRVNIAFALFAGSASIWSFGYFMWQISNQASTALFWSRMLMAGAIFIPVTYFHFVLAVIGLLNKKKRNFLTLSYVLFFLFLLLNFTPYFVSHVEKIYSFNFWPVPGPTYHFFLVIWFLYVIYSSYLLYLKYKTSKGITREQIKYVLSGIVIGFIGGSTNYFLWYKIPIPPVANILVSVYVGTTAYAIIRHRFMDIKFVLRKTLSYSLLVLAIALTYLIVMYAVLRPLTEYTTISRPVLYSVWGMIIVFAFQPIKRFIDRITDRIFFRRGYNYQDVLAEIGNITSATVDLEKLIKSVSDLVINRLHLSQAFFFIRIKNHEDYFLLAKDNIIPSNTKPKSSGQQLEYPLNHYLIRYFIRNKKILITEELKREIINEEREGDVAQHKKILSELKSLKAEVVIPLATKKELIGLLALGEKRSEDIFTGGDIRFFELLASQIATALERTRLYDKLEIKINELVTLQEVEAAINSTLDLEKTLNLVMEAVMKIIRVDRALLYLLDESGKYLLAAVGRGDKEELYQGLKVDLNKSILSQVLKTKKPLVVEDITKDKRINLEHARAIKTKGFIAVPLMTKDKALGVIGVDNLKSGRPLSTVNTELLMTLANQAAIAIDNTRLYQEVQDFNVNLKQKVADATKRLRELLKIKSDFLTIASHQLRTPTSIVRGMLSLVQEEEDLPEEERQKFIKQAYEGINRLERIIHDLLNATELEGKKMHLELKKTSVEEVVKESVKALKPLAQSKKIRLKFKTPTPPLPKTTIDPLRLKEAVANIIDNAIHYTPQGEVSINLEKERSKIRIIVKDTGIGMSKADQKILFKKFSRGAGILQVHPNGTGLGLFIAKKMLEAMGGTIEAESPGKGKGSTFTLTLPVK